MLMVTALAVGRSLLGGFSDDLDALGYQAVEGQELAIDTLDLLGNDIIPGGLVVDQDGNVFVSVNAVSDVVNGTVDLSDLPTSISFTPAAAGACSFKYTAQHIFGQIYSATVTFTAAAASVSDAQFDYNFTADTLPAAITCLRAGIGTAVNGAQDIAPYATNVPRFDHDVLTGTSLGLRVEGARTNLAKNGNMAQGTGSAANPQDYAAATSGTRAPAASTLGNADSAVAYSQNSAAERPFMSSAITFPDGLVYTASCWFEALVNNIAVLGFFGLLGGTVTIAGSTFVNAPFPQRQSITGTGQAAGAGSLRSGLGVSTTATGSATTSRHQIEQGDFPSTYIPTNPNATATRPAETFNQLTSSISFNEASSNIILQAITAPGIGTVDQVLWQVDDGTEDSRVRVFRDTSRHIRCQVVDAGLLQCDLDMGVKADNTLLKLSFGWTADTFSASMDGSAVVSDTLGSVPTGLTTIRWGHNSAGANHWWGTIKAGTYYRRRRSNSEQVADTGGTDGGSSGGGGGSGGGAELPLTWYGNGHQATSLGNTSFGAGSNGVPSRLIAYRTRIRHTGSIIKLRGFVTHYVGDHGATKGGYSNGTGGTIRVKFYRNNPADNRADLSSQIGSGTATFVVATLGTGTANHSKAGVLWPTLSAPVPVLRGDLVHMVFDNTDANPVANWAGLDFLNISYQPRPSNPQIDDLDERHYYGTPGNWHDRFDRTTFCHELIFADGYTQGCGYMECWLAGGGDPSHGKPHLDGKIAVIALSGEVNQPSKPNGQIVRQSFVPDATFVAKSLSFRYGLQTGSADLVCRIENSDGSLIEQVNFTAAQSPSGGGSANHRWVQKALAANRTFVAGTTYRLRFNTTGSTVYVCYPTRDGSSTQGYSRGDSVTINGKAEYSTNAGAAWQNWLAWGAHNDEGDLQFYFIKA